MDIFDLSVIVKAQGTDEVVAGLRQIQAQADLTDQELVKLANRMSTTLGGDLAAKIQSGVAALKQVPRDVSTIVSSMSATTAATSVAADAVDTFGRRAALATEGVSRGFLSMANTGTLAGRSAGRVLSSVADLAFGFGVSGPIVGAIAIGGVAIADYFARIGREATEAAAKAQEAFAKLLTTGNQKQLADAATDAANKLPDLLRQIEEAKKTAQETMGKPEYQAAAEDLKTLQEQLTALQGTISAAQKYGTIRQTDDDNAVRSATLLRDMEDARSAILQKTGALQTAQDENHVRAAALINSHLTQEQSRLATLEAQFKALTKATSPNTYAEAATIQRDVTGPDNELKNRQREQSDTRAEQQAGRDDKSADKKQADPLEELQKEIDLTVKGTEIRATAAKSYAELAGIVDALTARIKANNESGETEIRLNELLGKAQQPIVDATNRRIESAAELARASATQAQGIGQLTALQTELTAAQARGFASDAQAATNKRQLAEVTRDLTEAQKKDDSGLIEQLKYYQTAPGAMVDVIAREIELRQIINDKTKSLQEQAAALRDLATLTKAAGAPEDPKQIAKDQATAAAAEVDAVFKNLPKNIATSLSQGIGKGLQDAFKAPNVSAGLQALSKDILSGLGNMMVQQGEALLAYSDIMQALAAGLASVFGAGPVAALAGVALIALGSAFGAIASGSYSGGGGGGGLSQRSYVPTQTYTSLYAGGPGSLSPGQGQMPAINVGPVIGTSDPAAQKAIVDMVTAALNNNYGRVGLARALPR